PWRPAGPPVHRSGRSDTSVHRIRRYGPAVAHARTRAGWRCWSPRRRPGRRATEAARPSASPHHHGPSDVLGVRSEPDGAGGLVEDGVPDRVAPAGELRLREELLGFGVEADQAVGGDPALEEPDTA